MKEIPRGMFDMFALSRVSGLSFGNDVPICAWSSDDGVTVAALTANDVDRTFGVFVMRRQVDGVWKITRREFALDSRDVAEARAMQSIIDGAPPEPLPRSTSARPPLWEIANVAPSNIFRSLTRPTHRLAAWALNQLYLAFPNPDKNWASDCQTGNFHARLWEAQLLGSLREQGLRVTQDHVSPDFRVENRYGHAWIEAVTANPSTPYDHFNAAPEPEPASRHLRLAGAAAARFAKTIRSKLQRGYHLQAHVAGAPFAIALADFHAPSSMLWSRGALPSYLYGLEATVVQREGVRSAVSIDLDFLDGPECIPAGIFKTAAYSHLSAVIFSNACTIAKLNRVPISAGADPGPYRYVRFGEFFDRTPGALKSIPFSLDVASAEYRQLWPMYEYEPWSAEIEVFHNPFAEHPIPNELLPEVTHWRIVDGELICQARYEASILRSRTLVIPASDPIPTVEQLFTTDNGDDE